MESDGFTGINKTVAYHTPAGNVDTYARHVGSDSEAWNGVRVKPTEGSAVLMYNLVARGHRLGEVLFDECSHMID